MQRLPEVGNIVSTVSLNRPELRIYPRRDLAVRLGISTESLSETIRVATIGDVAPALAHFDAGDRIVPIRVLLEEHARADKQVLEQIRVPSPRGVLVPLAALADISFGEGPITINRHNRDRLATVEADLVGNAALSDAIKGFHGLPVMKNLPPGVTVLEGGDAELQDELFEGFSEAMRNGLTMVYVVLAVLFSSLLQPLTILFSLPLSVSGAILSPPHEFSTLGTVSRQAGRGNTVPCQDVVLLPADRTEPSCKDVCPRPRLRRRQKTKEVFEQISWGRSADARKAIGHTSSAWLYAPHRTRQVRTDLNGRAGRFVTEFV